MYVSFNGEVCGISIEERNINGQNQTDRCFLPNTSKE